MIEVLVVVAVAVVVVAVVVLGVTNTTVCYRLSATRYGYRCLDDGDEDYCWYDDVSLFRLDK